MNLNEAWGVADVLRQAQTEKEKVEVHLSSGKSFSGKVSGVGDHFVHLSELVGKEFFSAVVRIDDISAVEVRVKR